jgi:peptidoglycan/LPS O-acetylase OafA/YrhL
MLRFYLTTNLCLFLIQFFHMQKNSTGKTRSLYFNNLDGLRFIAFFYVFLFHSFFTTPDSLTTNAVYALLHFLTANGDLGVSLFFVLSGFLITLLLLQEERTTGTINIRFFYIRRVLRIWPLYYLTLFFGFALFPLLLRSNGIPFTETANPLSYLFFLGNFDIINREPASSSLAVLWSVAIEEQFYLFWPLLLQLFKRQRPVLFVLIIALSLVFRAFHLEDSAVLFYHTMSVSGDLVIGGFLGWLCFTRGWEQQSICFRYYPVIRFTTLVLLISITLFRKQLFAWPTLMLFERLIIAALFAVLLFDQTYAKRPLFQLSKNRFATTWGQYSYGLYCLHIPAMVFSTGLTMFMHHLPPLWNSAFLLPLFTLILSMVLSYSSFHLLEKPFLKLKKKFTVQ